MEGRRNREKKKRQKKKKGKKNQKWQVEEGNRLMGDKQEKK